MVYKCDRCGYKTDSNQGFKRHLYEKKNPCKSKINNVNLSVIKRKYQYLKGNICPNCDKSFSTKYTLKTHTDTCCRQTLSELNSIKILKQQSILLELQIRLLKLEIKSTGKRNTI